MSGIVLVLIALLTIGTGGTILFATLLIVSLIGAYELLKALKVQDEKLNTLSAASYIGIILYYAAVVLPDVRIGHMHINNLDLPGMALISSLMLVMCVYVFTFPRYHANQVTGALFAVIYVGVMLSYIYQTRMIEGGKYHVWLIFLCSWGADTCAYCVGILFGKHKMAPALSPKKSIEGAVGGVCGAALLGFLFQLATYGLSYQYAIICAFGAVISMVGDLGASAIKRNMGIKDYGTLIPGHGGIMDRFDSVIFTAPVIYYLSSFLIG